MAQQSTAYSILEKFGKDVVDALDKSLGRDNEASGSLRESIHFRLKILGESMVFQLMLEDYYIFVDEGRKAGKGIPIDELRKWLNRPSVISRLNRKPKLNKKGKPVYLKIGNQKQLDSLIFPINRKIRLNGIKPTHFYSKVVNKTLVDTLKKDLIQATKKDIIITIKRD